MKTKIFIGLVLLTFGLTFLVVGEVLAAKKSSTVSAKVLLPVDGAHPPEPTSAPSPVMYESMQPDCEDIHPTIGFQNVIQHDQFGSTYYDKQKNGSMGRMIAVGPGGHRHTIFHEARGPYPPNPRWVTYNCKDPLDNWLAPFVGVHIDGGTGINAGYAQMLVMHDGREIALYHHTQGTPLWNSTLAIGDEGLICSGSFSNLYDLPDKIDASMTEEPEGMWPKGCMVHVPYDPEPDSDYVHYVVTESGPPGYTGAQSFGYARCVLRGNQLVCHAPGGLGPYTRNPNQAYPSDLHVIAVIDTIQTISTIVVSSPVSEKVAIVYTKQREDAQVNNDVVYIESDSNGNDWINGNNWPATRHNVTSYPPGDGPRAYCDVAACYDYNDDLHIVWNAHYYDSVAGTVTWAADLYHWSDISPPGQDIHLIALGPSDGIYPGTWNRTISKMSISAQDPIYHPGGDPDSVYLFVTWTQFDTGDVSLCGMTNGDIYVAVSKDGGQTWTPRYNLTNTQTPDCEPGECLGEHYSSLAENLYDGDLHIQYVCDRDPGRAVGDEGTWTDNPMMYLHIEEPPAEPTCGISYTLVDPPSFSVPPIKVLPDSFREVSFEIHGMYNLGGDFTVISNNPAIQITDNTSGYLSPGETKTVRATIDCPGEEFINATITINGCIGTEDDTTIEFPLYAVCSDDYYECDQDSLTWIEKDNGTLKLWACVNTSQEVWDRRIEPEDKQKVIFSGGVIVATTAEGDTVVGRQDHKDIFTGARDTINNIIGYDDYIEPECFIQMILVRDTYIWTPHLDPPNDFKWWWIDIYKQIIMYHDCPGSTCPEWKKEQVIKYVWIDWSPPPVWWPDPGVYQGHEDIYLGLFADVDAPFDEGCYGCNTAGWDEDRQMVWLHGWYNDTLPDGHPEYEDHYVGLALTDEDGNVVVPLGAQIVLAEDYLYPQSGWGWKDGELYQLAATSGVNIHHPDSVADRTVVITADMIPAGTDDDFESEFILIEASVPTGLEDLQAHIDTTREVIIPELRDRGIFFKRFYLPECGDVNADGEVNSGDIISLIHPLFIGSAPPMWPVECRADVNNDGTVDVGDIVYLINYLYRGLSPPRCPDHCYYPSPP